MSEKDINNLKEMIIDFDEYDTDYTKSRCRELEETIENTLQEIERLNNIINEIEKELDKEYDSYITKNVIYGKTFKAGANVFREHIKYRLQELKGSEKE